MGEKPILFSGQLVRALLAGNKSVTRRVVKEPRVATLHGRRSIPERHFFDRGLGDGGYVHWAYGYGDLGIDYQSVRVPCPYGVPGDRLWVKETFGFTTGNGKRLIYRADGEEPMGLDGNPVLGKMTWRPSIFMRREYSRLTLEVTDIRAERLQEIDAYDVVCEGIDLGVHQCGCEVCSRSSTLCTATQSSLTLAWIVLWDSINGKRPGCSWEGSPWVWRVAFRVVPAGEGRAG